MTVEALYESMGGNYADVKGRLMSDRIISKFIVKFPNDPSFETLKTACAQNDADAIFKAAHTMKGVCATLALSELLEPVEIMTEAYRPGHPENAADFSMPDVLTRIEEKYTKVIGLIKQFEAEQA